MMTQPVIGEILQTIFQLPTGFIVPKQGNWYNPQDETNSGTWIAYLIRNPKPMLYPRFEPSDVDTDPILSVPMMATLELQFVGPDAEALAQSVSLWPIRADINALFDANQAQVMYGNVGAYEVSNFAQQGLNGVLAYNVHLQIEWENMIQTGSTIVTTISGFSGSVEVTGE